MSLISLSTAQRNTIAIAISDVINILGKDCKLYYPPKYIECVNCVNGHWKTGGPMYFTMGVCPLCGGAPPPKTVETTQTVKMTLDWNPQKYFKLFPNIDIRDPKNIILSRGYIADMPKVAQADYMVIAQMEAYKHFKFKLVGEPIDPHSIAQGQFFVAFWERNG